MLIARADPAIVSFDRYWTLCSISSSVFLGPRALVDFFSSSSSQFDEKKKKE